MITTIRLLILLFAFALTCSRTFAADDASVIAKMRIDSLKNLLKSPTLTDKQKLDIYGVIVADYSGFGIDSVIAYAPKAIEFAEKLQDKKLALQNYIDLGVAYCFRSRWDEAFFYFDKMKQIAVKIGDKELEISALSMYAFAYVHQGKYLTAIDYYTKALAMLESITPKDVNLNQRYASVLANLAELNRKLNNTEVAIQYLDKAAEICDKLKSNRGFYYWRIEHVYNEYAANYLEQGNLNKALEYALKVDSLVGSLFVDRINTCDTKRLLARIYLQRGDNELALQYTKEAVVANKNVEDKILDVNIKIIFSDIYLAQKRYAEAETEALMAWTADSTDIDNTRVAALNIALANIYMHNTDKAAYYLKKYDELNTEYSKKSFQTTVSDLSIRYETTKKELQISSLKKKEMRYILISIFGVLLTLGIGIFSWQKLRREQLEKQLIATDAVLEWEEKERKRFASELHDGINGMLSALKIELDTPEYSIQNVSNKLDECIETIRRMAHGLMPASLERYGMKAALEDHCHLFPNVSFHFFGENRRVNRKIELVIFYCTYELLNNSFKYAQANNINVQLVQGKKYISLTVQDDGCGFDKKAISQGSGLKNITNRVASCKGKLDIATSPGNGTETVIELRVKS